MSITITIRDKNVADEDNNSPYTVIITRDGTSWTAYKTIAEFMEQWHDTISHINFNTLNFSGQKALCLRTDWVCNDKHLYYDGMEQAWANGARKCDLMSNGSMMPGAILVDANNKQTTFFRLNPNDAKYKELERK